LRQGLRRSAHLPAHPLEEGVLHPAEVVLLPFHANGGVFNRGHHQGVVPEVDGDVDSRFELGKSGYKGGRFESVWRRRVRSGGTPRA
jgi:hypothetical protein